MPSRRILIARSREIAIALCCSAAGLVLHLVVRHFLHPLSIFVMFYPVVMLAAMLGGVVSGLFACGFSVLAINTILVSTARPVIVTSRPNGVTLLIFIATCSVVSVMVSERDRRVRQQALQANDAADDARRELAEVNSRIKTVFENIEEGVLCMDRSGASILANAAVTRILGASAATFGDPSSDPRLLALNEDGCPVRSDEMPSARVLATGQSVNNVLLNLPDANGNRHWLRTSARPILGESGTLEGAVVSFSDVTAAKLASDEVQSSRDRLERLIRNAPFGIVMFDRQMRYLCVSEQYLKDFGLEGRNLIGLCHYDVFPDLPFALRSVHNRALDGEQVSSSGVEFPLPNGTTFFIRWEMLPWHESSGAIGGVILFTENITQQRDTQFALEQAMERFRKAFLLSPFPVILINWDNGLIIDANEAQLRLMDRSHDEVIGRRTSDFGFWVDLHERERLRTIVTISGSARAFRMKFRRGDGEIRDGVIDAQQLEIGGQSCVVNITRDITDEIRIEEQLLQAHTMETVERLAGGLAHDFNNLLGVISAATELADENPGAVARHLDRIRVATARAAELTGQLLALSNHDAVFPRPLDLNDVLRNVKTRLRDSSSCNCQIVVMSEVKSALIHADPTLTERALTILATKACETSGRRRVILRLSTDTFTPEEAVLQHPACSAQSYFLISVKDSGPGMDPEQLNRIFEPFSNTRPGIVTDGLGYAVVQGIAAQSGGFVRAHSEPGRGSTFTIFFPAVPSEPSRPLEHVIPLATVEAARKAQPVVLVVEDNAPLRELTIEMLGDAGFQTLEADSAEAALDLISREKPHIDLLLTDVIMPGRNGVELHGDLTATYPGAKVLFMSGYPSDVLSTRAGAATEETFLQKPFNRAKLLAKVKGLLQYNVDSFRDAAVR